MSECCYLGKVHLNVQSKESKVNECGVFRRENPTESIGMIHFMYIAFNLVN
jgi:hypothetical protein